MYNNNNVGRVTILQTDRASNTIEVELCAVEGRRYSHVINVYLVGTSKVTTTVCHSKREAVYLYETILQKYKDILWGIDIAVQEALTREVERLSWKAGQELGQA